uniref:Uncharacterized protein n=1 Tax=Glossina austeni TaxID=7395 RepID=A0A1A9VHQ6_GLOAU
MIVREIYKKKVKECCRKEKHSASLNKKSDQKVVTKHFHRESIKHKQYPCTMPFEKLGTFILLNAYLKYLYIILNISAFFLCSYANNRSTPHFELLINVFYISHSFIRDIFSVLTIRPGEVHPVYNARRRVCMYGRLLVPSAPCLGQFVPENLIISKILIKFMRDDKKNKPVS